MTKPKPPFWKQAKPRKREPPKTLAENQREAARAHAQAAGRRYPNLVDNAWAARFVPPIFPPEPI